MSRHSSERGGETIYLASPLPMTHAPSIAQGVVKCPLSTGEGGQHLANLDFCSFRWSHVVFDAFMLHQ